MADSPSLLKTRTDVLNHLIERFKYESYLEIGLRAAARNFNHVRCAVKHSVDPDPNARATFVMTSDEFFGLQSDFYDIIFVDGLHTEEQVDRDIAGSLERLNKDGTIVLHDCNPPTEWHQRPVECFTLGEPWNGTVWRSYAKLRMTRRDLFQCVVDTDHGVGIVRRGRQALFPSARLSYALLDAHRQLLLNLAEPDIVACARAIP